MTSITKDSTAQTAPVIAMNGTPPILRVLIGELSNIGFVRARNGKATPANPVTVQLIAAGIMSIAYSRNAMSMAEEKLINAPYKIATMKDTTTMNAGVWYFELTDEKTLGMTLSREYAMKFRVMNGTQQRAYKNDQRANPIVITTPRGMLGAKSIALKSMDPWGKNIGNASAC